MRFSLTGMGDGREKQALLEQIRRCLREGNIADRRQIEARIAAALGRDDEVLQVTRSGELTPLSRRRARALLGDARRMLAMIHEPGNERSTRKLIAKMEQRATGLFAIGRPWERLLGEKRRAWRPRWRRKLWKMTLASDFLKSKTTWAGFAAIVAAVGTYVTHQQSLAQMEQQVVMALLAIFFRDTVAKSGERIAASRE